MPELHIHHEDEQLEITFGEYRSTIVWADIASWTPEYVRDNAAAYGHKLFEQITQDASLRDALLKTPRRSRLVLVAEQPEVAAIPWEYLRLPETSGSLLLATRYNIVRGIPEGQRQESFALDSGLRIVAVPVSAVNELVPLDTEGEWKDLRDKVRERNKVVTLQRVRPPTLKAMRSAVNGEGTKIVQFMGHSNEGVLVFEDELGRAEPIASMKFVDALDEQTLLVVLNSCKSAIASNVASGAESVSKVSPFANIARLVVHEGVPYALGMQFSLPDDAALAITKSLYDYLLNGRSIEEAARLMRADIEDNARLHNTHWLAGVPVLYTSLREPAPTLKLATGQPTLIPDPARFAQSFDLRALSTPQHFFGRADDISETLDALQDTSKRGFVVLHGLGGIGKTTLARIAAERISWHYQDRVLAYSFETFARFAFEGDNTRTTVDTQFAARFYNKLATFYGLDPSQYPETRDLQNAILRQRTHIRSLLILDNIETLVYAQKQKDEKAVQLAAFIRDLQHGEGDILLTTREMPPADWGERKEIHLLGLNDDAGAELFLASIALDRKDAASKADRIALSQSVYGHPLCIRLLAGRFSEDKAGNLATFNKNLTGELGRSKQATPTSPDDPSRHETIDNCIAYSVRRLTPQLANVLYTIGIFRAPFHLKFAERVLDDEEHTTEKHLQDLVRLGLLEQFRVYFEEDYFEFYELHPMLRLYIKPNVEALNAETRQRYGEVYENLTQYACTGKYSYDSSASTRYLLRQSLPDCEAALKDEDIEPIIRGLIAYYSAQSYVKMGQVKHALILYKDSLAIMQELEHEKGILVVQHGMADALVKQGHVDEAMDLYKQSLDLYKKLADARGVSVVQHAMADLLARQGRRSEAMELYKQSLKSKEERGDVFEIAMTQQAMGHVLVQQGHVDEAMKLYEQSLKTMQHLRILSMVAAIQHAMALALTHQKRLNEAMKLYEQSLKTKQELGDVREIAITQHAMAHVLMQQERVDEAKELYENSLKMYEEVGDVRGIAAVQTTLSSFLWFQGEYVKSLTVIWQKYKSLSKQDFPIEIQEIQGLLILFKESFLDEKRAFDALWLQATSEPQPVWLNDVQVGSSANNVTLTEEEKDGIGQAITLFVTAETWEAKQRVVEAQRDVLFRPGIELAFEQTIKQEKASGEQNKAEMLEIHLAVLRACKADGIATTFERVRAMGQEGEE